MKTLKKVKIINWHYFWNETINIEPIVFLTGLNASGKSTLIDAFQIILLGDTSGRFFNKAASEKSARTLKGYLRGELGDSDDGGFNYLRTGRFSSYIVLEFYDDLKETSFSLGAVFDSFEDGSDEHRFFLLEDKIPDNEFIVDSVPMEYKKLSQFFSTNYPNKYRFVDTNRQYQELLKKKFGNLKDKYFSLFKKAVSFTPITDITTFITEYVCDAQSNISIDTMQSNIMQYKKLENEALIMKMRIERLEEIESTYNSFAVNNQNMELFSYIVERASCKNDENRLETYITEIKTARTRLLEIDRDLADLDVNIAKFNRRKTQLISDKASNDTYRLTDEMQEQKAETIEKLASIDRDTKQVKANLEKYADAFISVASDLIDTVNKFDAKSMNGDYDLKELLDCASKVIATSSNLRDKELVSIETLSAETLKEWRDSLATFKNQISAVSVSISRLIFNTDKQTNALRGQESDMRNGAKSYDRNLSNIKIELENTLSLKHGKPVKVHLFADLIDIKTPLWTNAIEGFLYGQKFNLFVDEKYYLEAYEILRELLSRNNYYGTTLVDQERIIERKYESEVNSLAEEIITDHQGARAYANYLIGRLKKCKTAREARESANGITPECDIYRNFSLGRINPRLYGLAVIGRSVGENQIAAKRLEIDKNNKLTEMLKAIHAIVAKATNLEIINTNEINTTLSLIDATREIKGLQQTLDYLERELGKHDVSQIDSFNRRITAIEDDIKALETEKQALYEEKGKLSSSITITEDERIPETKANIAQRVQHLEENYDAFFVNETARPMFEELIENKKTTLEIVKEFNSKVSQAQYKAQTVFTHLISIRKDYVHEYRLSHDTECKDNKAYSDELKDMRDVKLPEYQLAITDAYNRATKQFKDDFIAKLKTAIETVEGQIEELNYALNQSKFGNDSYRFTCRPSQLYFRYYEMIKDELLLTLGEDDAAFVEKYAEVMNDLFKQIVDVGIKGDRASALAANVEKFTDYRSYLDFDLIVTNNEGVEQRLSKMIKKKSGGETQTPFYIAVLASFAQLYRVNEHGELGNSMRLIVFDEAFSKMDRGRIKESVKLLRKFKLQAILSAPSDKIADISELVDETLVVLHEKNTSRVRLYAKEDNVSFKVKA